MQQRIFTGTDAEYERYRKKRKFFPVKIRVIEEYENDQLEENIVPDEQLPKSHILHPSHREWLLEKLKEGDDDIRAGRVHEATPEFFENIKKQGRERLLKTQK